MRGVTFAYLGKDEAASRLAKKGTATDVTLYNAKHGDAHLNLVVPSRFPEKVQSLLVSLDLSDEIILDVSQLDRSLGEMVLGAELMGKHRGHLLVRPPLMPEQVQPLLAPTALKDLRLVTEPEPVFRERLYESAASGSDGNLVVPIDHAFPVKGVGTVALGLVRSGVLEAHQSLRLYPTEKMVEVRSIQVHDVDAKMAPARSRVGAALKGVEADEISRGQVLAPPGSLSVLPTEVPLRLRIAPTRFSKWTPRPGAVFHLSHGLQIAAARIDAVEESGKESLAATVRLEAPLVVLPHAPMVAVDLDNKAQRFIGRAKLTP